jgi:hypothetical protein
LAHAGLSVSWATRQTWTDAPCQFSAAVAFPPAARVRLLEDHENDLAPVQRGEVFGKPTAILRPRHREHPQRPRIGLRIGDEQHLVRPPRRPLRKRHCLAVSRDPSTFREIGGTTSDTVFRAHKTPPRTRSRAAKSPPYPKDGATGDNAVERVVGEAACCQYALVATEVRTKGRHERRWLLAPFLPPIAEGVAERVALQTADMTALPFADNSFDVVLSSLAIHNIRGYAGREQAIREAVRVLRPGGRLMIVDVRANHQHQIQLAQIGMKDVTRRWLGRRVWWNLPMGLTQLVIATKPGYDRTSTELNHRDRM